MNHSQSKKIQEALKLIQNARRILDKESVKGLTGIGADYGTEIDLNEAIFGTLYAEKSLARIWERENFIRVIPESTKKLIKIKNPESRSHRHGLWNGK